MTRQDFFRTISAAISAPLAASEEPIPAPVIHEVPAGKLYALEFPHAIRAEEYARISQELQQFRDKFKCDFIICAGGVKLRDPSVMDERAIEAVAKRFAAKLTELHIEQEPDSGRPKFYCDTWELDFEVREQKRREGFQIVHVPRCGEWRDKAVWQEYVDRMNGSNG